LPRKIFGAIKNSFIERVAAGKNHSLALSNEGVAFGWGSNLESQLGVSKLDSPVVTFPIKLQLMGTYGKSKKSSVKLIRANGNYSLFLTEAKRCYVSDINSISFVQISIDRASVVN